MTRKSTRPEDGRPTGSGSSAAASWRLQDAKARFSELVRQVETEGPQRVTVHGREAVVVVSAAEYRRLSGEPGGEVLIEAFAASPHRDVDLAPQRHAAPVRDVAL